MERILRVVYTYIKKDKCRLISTLSPLRGYNGQLYSFFKKKNKKKKLVFLKLCLLTRVLKS